MAASHVHDDPGPLTDEAARLLAAAQSWLQRSVGDAGAGRIATGSPECAWCPICQLISLLRGDRVDVTRSAVAERFAEAQTAVAALVRALAEVVTAMAPQTTPSDRAPDGQGDGAAGRPRPSAGAASEHGPERVQRIDLTGPEVC